MKFLPLSIGGILSLLIVMNGWNWSLFFFVFLMPKLWHLLTPMIKSAQAVHLSKYFSYRTKSRIFRDLNLRKKTDLNFRCSFPKNHFRHLKLYSNLPSWLARKRCHIGNFWKKKDWSSQFWENQPFRSWYVEFHCQRRLKSAKTGISS